MKSLTGARSSPDQYFGIVPSGADVFIHLAEIFICRLNAARVIQWRKRVMVGRKISVPEK
jgi:hypothetical protein